MSSSTRSFALIVAGVLVLTTRAAADLIVDGWRDPDYGPPLAAQTTQTSFVDANPIYSPNPTLIADGTELDALYGTITDGVLHLLLTGNMGFCCPTMFSHREDFNVFVDVGAGGQHTLRPDNATVGWAAGNALNGLAGLTFDAGFDADYWLACTVNMSSAYAELLTDGGGAGAYLGYNFIGAPGTLTGGTNPFAILAAVDNSNGAGVTAGCGASSGADVTTGVEWAIPLAAIGNPGGCVRVCVLAANAESRLIGNQALGPLPPGTCALGAPSGVDLGSIPGDQYVTICPSTTGVGPGDERGFAVRPTRNPARGPVPFELRVPRAGHAVLAIFDLRGRRLATPLDHDVGPGVQTVSWDGCDASSRPVGAGLVFYRARLGALEQQGTLIVLR